MSRDERLRRVDSEPIACLWSRSVWQRPAFAWLGGGPGHPSRRKLLYLHEQFYVSCPKYALLKGAQEDSLRSLVDRRGDAWGFCFGCSVHAFGAWSARLHRRLPKRRPRSAIGAVANHVFIDNRVRPAGIMGNACRVPSAQDTPATATDGDCPGER